jgi:ribonuclease P protein component
VGIPRTNRLRRNSDFQRVRASGRSWTNRWLVLSALSNDLGCVRVGVAASRRVGGAVVRVRARRRMREAVRPWLGQISGGWDLVFIARAPLVSASFQDVDRAVTQLLQRAGLVPEVRR